MPWMHSLIQNVERVLTWGIEMKTELLLTPLLNAHSHLITTPQNVYDYRRIQL